MRLVAELDDQDKQAAEKKDRLLALEMSEKERLAIESE
jgi:hypothetical protein